MPAGRGETRVGIIGYGAIGRELASAIAAGRAGESRLCAVLLRRAEAARSVHVATGAHGETDRDGFLSHAPHLVVECAGHQVVRDHAVPLLEAGCSLMVSSAGAFADGTLWERCVDAASRHGARLLLPSAGVGALDALSAAAEGGLDDVEIVVRKAPNAWRGTPAERQIDLDAMTRSVRVYEGSVREGARLYPQNVNIAAAVALAGIGLDRTRLVIEIDPSATHHEVEVRAQGAFGSFAFSLKNRPSIDNPKTGRLVSMALIKAVRQFTASTVIGV